MFLIDASDYEKPLFFFSAIHKWEPFRPLTRLFGFTDFPDMNCRFFLE